MNKTKLLNELKGTLMNPIVEHTDTSHLSPGFEVVSRDGKIKGQLTGGSRTCQLEGCLGRRLGVRWSDGTLTWPCTKGMTLRKKSWRIM